MVIVNKMLKKRHYPQKEILIYLFLTVLITLIGFIAAYQFVGPSPPRSISMATGSPGGAYFQYGQHYKKFLKESRVELKLRITSGSLQNLRLLEKNTGGVDVAFIQGGTGKLSNSSDIISLGSLYYEPLWVFCGPETKPNHIADMKGLRIAVGDELSGTKILSTQLLELNGITQKNTQLISKGPQISVDMFLNNDVDVAFFVATHRAPYITKLLSQESVSLFEFDRAEAYKIRYPFLNIITLPEGVIDFEADIPARDIKLLAPTAQLAARADLHPALIDLLLQAARAGHMAGGGLEKRGEFPSSRYLDFELSEEAERFYTSRPPFFQRYFPFWVATFLSRMKIMALPLIVLLLPLVKVVPWIYRWRVRARIYRWYSDLEEVGSEIHKTHSLKEYDDFIVKLDQLEKNVSNIHVPKPYAEGLFHLRMHIEMFRKKLMEETNLMR